MKKLESIDKILLRMIELLHAGEEGDWAAALNKVRKDFKHDDFSYAASNTAFLYGGMGSLGDVVLYRDGKVLMPETNEFGLLREQLYEVINWG